MDGQIGLSSFFDILDDQVREASKKTTKLSADDLDTELRRTELEIRQEDLAGQKQDRDQRKKFANKIFWLLISFLFVSLGIVALSGCCKIHFHLSDTILITLLATTSADVIGVFLFVVRYLFKANVCNKCGVRISQTQTIDSE